MKIGIDVLALQSEQSRGRGIGRYVTNFLDHLLKNKQHEYILYVYDELPTDLVPVTGVEWRLVWPGESNMTGLNNCVGGNPDGLDLLLLTSPIQSYVRADSSIPRIYAIMYDLIPLLFPQRYARDQWFKDYYIAALKEISRYDKILTLSESARSDVIQHLNVHPHNVSVIGAAAHPSFSPTRSDLTQYGITKPFLFHLGGDDLRKGGDFLIKAFSKLSNKKDLHLIYGYQSSDKTQNEFKKLAQSLGVDLIHINSPSDELLRSLYSQCVSFVFPSEYEGFGLPILEAMSCGASVLARNNSSQTELVYNVGGLFNTEEDLVRQIEIITHDDNLNNLMKEFSLEKSKEYNWDKVVRKFLCEIEKPRLAVFSPVPPIQSGISKYNEELLDFFGEYDITIYCDVDKPHSKFHCKNHFKFNPLKHDHILYHIGNSVFHHYMEQYMKSYPGVTVLHELNLQGYQKSAGRKEEGLGNQFVFENSGAVITHSRQLAGPAHYVPFPVRYRPQKIKDIVDKPATIVVPGMIHESKDNKACLEAFSLLKDRTSKLIFVGEGDISVLKEIVSEKGLDDRVTFSGWLSEDDYEDILANADVGIILRKSPTNWETSAALFDLLSYGVPTIVSNVGTFREIHKDAVKKCKSPSNPRELVYLINYILVNKEFNQQLRTNALNYVRSNHLAENSAKMYKKIIHQQKGGG